MRAWFNEVVALLARQEQRWVDRMQHCRLATCRPLMMLCACALAGCGASRTTDTRSATLPDDASKIKFLQRYVKLPSDVEAAEFHVRFQDNSAGVPGPSDWDIQMVLKVPREQIAAWTANLQRTETADLSWGHALLPDEARWKIASTPEIYVRGATTVAVFASEGIVMKSTRSQ